MLEQKNLFLILESTNPYFFFTIYKGRERKEDKKSQLIHIFTETGNIVFAISPNLHKGKLNFIR